MKVDPQEFFIGLMNFFTILLPGAILTYLLMGQVGPVVLGDHYGKLVGAEAWAAFLIASYLLGHLVFLLGTWLDEFYGWARSHTLNAQITTLARRGRLLPWPGRALIWLVFKGERNIAMDRAVKIKEQALAAMQAKDSINAFQWCKALLKAENPESLAVVQRFEADSKFFRCFAVVLLLLLAAWPLQDRWPLAGIPVVLGLFLLAMWRYMEQRLKSTNQAYWSVITLTATAGKIAFDKPALVAGSPTHGGGVVFRVRLGTVQYLLVEASNDPNQWVLPKGHVEGSEGYRETAVRELREETGVWGRIVDDLGDVSYTVNGTIVTVRFYLMQAAGYSLRKDKGRRHKWLALQKAVARASHTETRKLLETGEQKRVRV